MKWHYGYNRWADRILDKIKKLQNDLEVWLIEYKLQNDPEVIENEQADLSPSKASDKRNRTSRAKGRRNGRGRK